MKYGTTKNITDFFDKCHPLVVVRRLTDSSANRNVTGR